MTTKSYILYQNRMCSVSTVMVSELANLLRKVAEVY